MPHAQNNETADDTELVAQHIGIGCHIPECSEVRALTLAMPAGADCETQLRPAAYRVIAAGEARWVLHDEGLSDGAEWTIHPDGHPRCPDQTDAGNQY